MAQKQKTESLTVYLTALPTELNGKGYIIGVTTSKFMAEHGNSFLIKEMTMDVEYNEDEVIRGLIDKLDKEDRENRKELNSKLRRTDGIRNRLQQITYVPKGEDGNDY